MKRETQTSLNELYDTARTTLGICEDDALGLCQVWIANADKRSAPALGAVTLAVLNARAPA